MGDKFWKFLIWVDITINDKWLGGKRETISGRCYNSTCRCCTFLCKMLDKVDSKHCEKAWLSEFNKANSKQRN